MEDSRPYIPKKKYEPGAQFVNKTILSEVVEFQTSSKRSDRVTHLAQIFLRLGDFMQENQISLEEVNQARKEKADKKGVLDKGVIREGRGQKKLVRDLIGKLPPREEDRGITFYTSDRSEHVRQLDIKLGEEVSELMEAQTREKRVEELADIFENIYAIMRFRNIDQDEIDSRIQSKLITQRRERRPLSKGPKKAA